MVILGALWIALAAGPARPAIDTSVLRVSKDSNLFIYIPRTISYESLTMKTAEPPDSLRQRRRSVDVGDWYARRLAIHRYAAFLSLPTFAFQYAAGERLYTHGAAAPAWARTGHRIGATALAGIFTTNTVTGAWNWWDSRKASSGRVLRTVHALSLLGADAAFTYAGLRLSDEAENNALKRRQHRTVALSAIAVSAISGIGMKILNR